MLEKNRKYTLSEFASILRESQEFKPVKGDNVDRENVKNNGKAVKDILTDTKSQDGGVKKEKKRENPRELKDFNKTTLEVDFAYEPSDQYKERVKAQVHGFPSAENEKNSKIEKDNESLDFEGNKDLYDEISDKYKDVTKRKKTIKKAGLKNRMLPDEAFKINTMFGESRVNEGYRNDCETPEEVAAKFHELCTRRDPIIQFENGKYIYIDYDPKTNKFYAGGVTNTGMSHEYEQDYDFDFSFDQNLEGLYEMLLQSGDFDDDEETIGEGVLPSANQAVAGTAQVNPAQQKNKNAKEIQTGKAHSATITFNKANESKTMKRLNFSKTIFLNENEMLKKIPDDMKKDGNKFYMRDSAGNEYLIECVKDDVINDFIHTKVVEYSNKQELNETFKRIKELYNYKPNTKQDYSQRELENKRVSQMIAESKKLINTKKDTQKEFFGKLLNESK